jgi:anti-sigma regulatory factor (Ser/Thr protein kinase)
MPQLRHHSSFPGTIEGVASASSWLRGVGAHQHLPDKLVFALEVCLEELFTNVVRHGGAGTWDEAAHADLPSPLSVELTLEIGRDAVLMIIEDNGHLFDVTEAPARPIGRPIEEVIPGGLGMQLIRSFSHDMRYEALELGNRVTLTFLQPQMAETKAAP